MMNASPPSERVFKAELIVARGWVPGHRIDQAYLKGQLKRDKMPRAQKWSRRKKENISLPLGWTSLEY